MKIDYSKRKHESPFAADPPKVSPPENVSPLNIQSPTYRPERSDKAQFSAFLGIFALIAVVPAAYWANYNYGIYQRYSASLEELREHPEKIPKDFPPALKIYIENTYVENARLEASLCSAGSLLLFIIGVWLFVRAFKISKRLKAAKLQYQPIDPRSVPPLKNPIQVKYTKFQTWLLFGLSGFFGLATLLNLKQLLTSQFTTTQDIIYKGVLFSGLILSLVGTFIFLTIRAKRRSVRSFDASGITRGDGRHFLWSDFRGAIKRIASSRFGAKYNWRTELVFADGSEAWIIPQRIKNYAEVYGFVETLPQAILKD